MDIEGIGLYYTLQCNASCAHCGVWSAPDRTERMTLPQARRYINAFAASANAKVVVFVGGEPLLHLDDICELIALVRSHRLLSQVSTNAFWAGSEVKAESVVGRLAFAGLDHLALSADAYHSEFIDPRNVGRAFAAARQHGLVRKLQVIRSAVSEETDRLWAATGIDPAEIIDHSVYKRNRHDPAFDAKRYIVVNRHWVAPFGRGAFLRGHVEAKSLAEVEDMPCFMVRRFPIVYPNGDLYTCCCTAGFYREYKVGNLERENLAELDARMNADPVFDAIARVGPVMLAKRMKACGTPLADRFANPCHACRETLGRSDRSELEAQAKGLLLLNSLFGDESVDARIQDLV